AARPAVETGLAADYQGSPGYALRATENSWPKIDVSAANDNPLTNPLSENFYLLLDGSGSMADKECSGGQSKMHTAIQALQAFLRLVPQNANFGLAVFNGGRTRELVPLTPTRQIRLESFSILPDGSTPLYSGIKFAYEKLLNQGKLQLGYGRYHLIVITDGMASENEDPTQLVQRILHESPVNLHAIGFCIGSDHSLNQPGRTVYHAAGNPAELSNGLESVLAEEPMFDASRFTQ
ncbi:MAG TPA: VWA domain-containing protein, partial [Gammaproteobacteria bacterium]|nr:VWA domain-containing protein [Gammaproteobacteria bacterium]